MNLKSLLWGTAAAITGFSTAEASDFILIEPEPNETVRVCDVYGSGFFFIPGTETCLKFSGFVRSSYERVTADFDITYLTFNTFTPPTGITAPTASVLGSAFTRIDLFRGTASGNTSSALWGQRARLDIDVRNETDFGTLRAQYRLEAGPSNTDADIDMDVALISLAGFRAGFAGANYWTTNHGFSGVNFESVAFVGEQQFFNEAGWFGFDDATIFDYTWASDGLAITIGVEDPRIRHTSSAGNSAVGDPFERINSLSGGSDSRVNIYTGINYSADFGTLALTAVHDSVAKEINSEGVISDEGGWAYKASLTLDLSKWLPGGKLHGWYMTDGDYATDYVHNLGLNANPDEIFGINFQMNITEEVQFLMGYTHAKGGNTQLDDDNFDYREGEAEQASVGLNWYPKAAPGYNVKAAYYSGNANSVRGFGARPSGWGTVVDIDYEGFVVSVRRDF